MSKITERQGHIVTFCQYGRLYSLGDIQESLRKNFGLETPSATLRRDLAALTKSGAMEQLGQKKATRYRLRREGLLLLEIDSHAYCQIEIDSRPGNTGYNFDLFPIELENLFSPEELSTLNQATLVYRESAHGASDTVYKKELERFVIELSWKSSKIEGNTYTLLDTELLIREGIEAEGHSREEAVMILNHKYAFDYILKNVAEFKKPTSGLIREVHSILVKDLAIPTGIRNRLIGITGSLYRPIQAQSQIEEAIDDLLFSLRKLKDPYSQALIALSGIAYIQPFEDGNKRTSRLLANAILIASECAPLSYRSINEISYREAILTFYEKNTIVPLKNIFMEQYLFSSENYLKIDATR